MHIEHQNSTTPIVTEQLVSTAKEYKRFFCPHCQAMTKSNKVTASLLSGTFTTYLAPCCGKQVSVRNTSEQLHQREGKYATR